MPILMGKAHTLPCPDWGPFYDHAAKTIGLVRPDHPFRGPERLTDDQLYALGAVYASGRVEPPRTGDYQ